MRASARLTLLVSLGGLLVHIAFGQVMTEPGFGAVEGMVMNATGRPVAGAKVYAAPVGREDLRGRLTTATSDQEGRFVIPHVLAGTAMIMARKEEEGYCNTLYALFVENLATLPTVTVAEGQVSRGVSVVLPSCAKLNGTVKDRKSGALIPEAHIRLSREDNPHLDLRMSVDGQFQFVLPKLPYTIEVDAPGYRAWKKSGFKLEPDTVTTIEVYLDRVK